MRTRHLPAEAYAGVKTATRLLVQQIGGVDAFAACTRATRSMASEYGAPHGERFIAADIVLDAEAVAAEPLVTAALARAQGYALVPVTARGAGALAAKLSEIGRDVAALLATAATALSHAEPTPAERAVLIGDLDQLARVAQETQMLLQEGAARHKKGGA